MSRNLEPIVKRILEEEGIDFRERPKTIQSVPCPQCGKSDKFSILKENGSCICYRGSCRFGRQWFDVWLSETANISLKAARVRIYGKKEDEPQSTPLLLDSAPQEEKKLEDYLLPLPWPEPGFLSLRDPESVDGLNYLLNRGISLEISEAYQIKYSPYTRRVIFPVIMDGICYGWQARAIDKDNPQRMLNNTGFKRERLVMFADNIKNLKRVIVAEGPVDALKFIKVGGFVCTMGKGFSDHQVELLSSTLPPGSIWLLAMDDDAIDEMHKLARMVAPDPVYRLYVPESCMERCKKVGKKPDFGECTPDECVESLKNAQVFYSRFSASSLMTYMKEG